jgi:hypothetical protein
MIGSSGIWIRSILWEGEVPNASYLRGVRLERELVNLGRAHGWIAYRSAGSHSCIDVTWLRAKDKLPGTAMEGVELIRSSGWYAEPSTSIIPDPFLYGFYRFTRGLDKHWIWVLAVDDNMNHVLAIQCKTQQNKKKKKKRNKK